MRIWIILLFAASVLLAGQTGLGKLLSPGQVNGEGTGFENKLYGNGIVDLLVYGDTVWAATGYGLSLTTDSGQNWRSFTSADYTAKGGVVALHRDPQTRRIWISTAFDTVASGEDLSAGGGLAWTDDLGQNWTYVRQPVDSREETNYSPTTTVIQNISWDIATLDGVVWITSWGGGLRRSADNGQNWQVVTVDGKPFRAANDNLIHLGFSVLAENGNLWVGTAEGIARSSDGGQTFTIFTHQNQNEPISGNFVVSLAWQEETSSLWAATIESVGSGEIRAVSTTSTSGQSWQTFLSGNFVHQIAFDGSRVYVAADEGLYVSEDGGANWYSFGPIRDQISGEEILRPLFYSVALNAPRLWTGTADGLASTQNNGFSWQVFRSFVSTREQKDPAVYAYPSPFSPSRQNYIRFQFDLNQPETVTICIYDFAMQQVAQISEAETVSGGEAADRSVKWDGRRSDGVQAASGVYYFKAKIGSEITWGKFVIIN